MSRAELDRINKKLFNAEMGLDKFGPNSPQGKSFEREIERLEARKRELSAQLAADLRERALSFASDLVAMIREWIGRSLRALRLN